MKIYAAFFLFALAATASAQEPTGTLKKIKDTGVITLGVRAASIPLSFLDDKQQYVGYHVDICSKVVDALKTRLQMPQLKVTTQEVTSANRQPQLVAGNIDLECGSTTNTLKRQEEVSFAYTTFVTDVKIMTKAKHGLKSLADLNGKILAITKGTTTVSLIRQQEKGQGLDIKELEAQDHAQSFLNLENDRAVAFGLDDYLLAGFRANSKNPQDYVFLPEVLRTEPIALMLRKDDPQFKELVDTTLATLMKSGEMEKLYRKWFLSPIPPRGANLNIPMSAALKQAFAEPNNLGAK
ncbi:MAG TPA: amino acid ABC transporter substrate-binding protein [Burkholderiales bacterium]|nr:amino acid ABC transporter substrate-binding protein [Burkholderiales bacterium]